MRKITELHNKYKDKPIWVIGSDPTLDNYPDDYLDNEITITLHLAYLKYPKATYHYFNEYDRITYLMSKDKSILNKDIVIGYPFYGRSREVSDEVIKKFKNVWYMDNFDYPPNGNPEDIFTDLGKTAMENLVSDAVKGKSNRYGSHGTCNHNAMYLAIMLGGNPINVIGCNFETIKGKEHYGDMHEVDSNMRKHTPPFSGYRHNRMINGFNSIVSGCKKAGIEINYYSDYEWSFNLNTSIW